VLLRVVVGIDGKPQDIKVVHSIGMGLDENAVEAVRLWRFEPGTKDGKAVPVEVSAEVTFHLGLGWGPRYSTGHDAPMGADPEKAQQ